jgi:hypothetical protein
MHIEPLDQRRLLAGNVEVAYADGKLTITGDDDENYFSILRAETGDGVVIQPNANTSINGAKKGTSATFPAPVNGLEIDLGRGFEDQVNLIGIRVGGHTRIVRPTSDSVGGSGWEVNIAHSRFSSLEIDADTAPTTQPTFNENVLAIRNTVIAGKLRVGFSNGAKDVLGIRDVRVGDGVEVSKRFSRPTFVTFNGVRVSGVSSVSTGGARDVVEMLGSEFDALSVRTRAGHDRIYERSTYYRVASSFDPGEGRNVVNRAVSLAWNFDKYTRRWEPGAVSNELSAQTVPTNAQAMESLGITAGIRDGAYTFTPADHVFNDYVFINHRLNTGDGLYVGQKYQLSFEVDVPRAFFDREVYVGATPFSQQLIRVPASGSNQVVLNTREGDTSPISNPGPDGTSGPFIHTHPNAVVTDSRGFLWLHVGVLRHAGTITGTPTAQIESVQVTLTPVG